MKTRHHEKYREWEAQEVYIEGLTFCNLDEMETQGQKSKIKVQMAKWVVTKDDKETQAIIGARVVDKNGNDFAKLNSYMKLLIFDERCI